MNKKVIKYLPESFFDSYKLCQGRCYKSYNFLGAHFMNYEGLNGVLFTVWAPNAKRINIVSNFNNWDGTHYSMKKISELGIWNIFISDVGKGEIYKYEIYTQKNERILKCDPYGYYCEVRPNTASIVMSLDNHIWNDSEWMNKKNKESKYEKPINIYELHLGSWRKKENGEFYNYKEIVHEIISYVKFMGYTHIELLPLMEHPFDGSWGYQITNYFSITSRYGNPSDFMYFIDICHQNEVGVILDWVPGHFCKDEHGLYKFDGTSLYEYDSFLMSENIQWGTAAFDHGKNEVCSYLISNALFWIDKYHIDGLRVDAVSYMLYLDAGKKDDKYIPNKYGGKENIDAIEFMRNLNKAVSTYYPNTLMIAEDSSAWPMVTGKVEIGGLGFDYKWNMGWMNDMLKYMEMDPVYRKYHHNLITFSFMYAFSEKYILPLSHDEVVHGKKSLLEKMPGSYWEKFANLRLLYTYMIAHPGKKLLFMGSEFGQFIEWNHKKELDWFLLGYDSHKNMQYFARKLNEFYKNEKSLYELESNDEGFSWIDHQNYEQSIIAFMRKGKKEDDFIIAIFNFTPMARYNYKIGVPKLGKYIEIFNSDLSEFGGSNIKNEKIINAINFKWNNQPYSIDITIPPLGALYIKLKK